MSLAMSNLRPSQRDPDRHSDYEAGGRPLNGWKVLAMIVGFFLFVGAVNGVMIYKALKTFSGEVVAHPYERGLAYNRDIAQAREQAARDWKVDVQFARVEAGKTEIRVTARDAQGGVVSGVAMSALFAAPADLSKDVRVPLTEAGPGRYVGRAALPAGQRDLVLTAERDGRQLFTSRNRVALD
jgi:nitrogen fixation protein FixH